MPEKMQLSNFLPCRTTPNYFEITNSVTRITTPFVFCFSRCPFSLVFLLHLTPLITLLLGTILPLDFLPHYYLLVSLGEHFLWIWIFLFSRGVLNGFEGQEPYPRENLDICKTVKTVKKAECWRIDAFKQWCWRRLLRVPWTARRSN